MIFQGETPTDVGNTAKARIIYPDMKVCYYDDSKLALEVYYALGRGIRAAFRAAGDTTPVYSHDYVDRP